MPSSPAPNFSGLCEDPQFVPGAAQVPPPTPPRASILAQLGSQCGAWAPDTDAAARATLQGPLSALQGAAPLANRGQCVCVVSVCVCRGDWLDPGVTKQGPGNVPASCLGAALCGKVGAPSPAG